MKSSTIKNNLIFLLGIFFWICIWWLISIIKSNINVVPSPYDTLKTLSKLIFQVQFIKSILYTLYRVFSGFLLSTLFGIGLGVVSGLYKWVFNVFNPLIVTVKSTPVISIIFVVLIWVKSDNVPIVISFLMAFPMIWTNTVEGIRTTDKKLLEMARIFKVKKLDVIQGIYLPSIRPFVISGVTYSVGISWKVSVAAEALSHPRYAIGSRLAESKIYIEMPEVFAWTLIVISMSFIFEYGIKYWISKLGTRKG